MLSRRCLSCARASWCQLWAYGIFSQGADVRARSAADSHSANNRMPPIGTAEPRFDGSAAFHGWGWHAEWGKGKDGDFILAFRDCDNDIHYV